MTCQECELKLGMDQDASEHLASCEYCRALAEDLRLNAVALREMKIRPGIARWQWAMALNPLAPVIEMMRYLLLGRGEVHADQFLISSAIAAFLLLAGVMIFQRTERTFIDPV